MENLAFDWGTGIVGVLDVCANVYTPYLGRERMIEGARRVVMAEGTIISFNGIRCDLPRLFELLMLSDQAEQVIRGTHHDMMKITSDIRWPPDPNTGSIMGPGLSATYEHYFGSEPLVAPDNVKGDYEQSNWRDCYMTAALWKGWKRGDLAQ